MSGIEISWERPSGANASDSRTHEIYGLPRIGADIAPLLDEAAGSPIRAFGDDNFFNF